jgi:ketosteroid isomerase-like protein
MRPTIKAERVSFSYQAKLRNQRVAYTVRGMSPEDKDLLRRAYAAFNARDIEAAVALMHPDVDWPNGWEGGRVHGRDAVREYWTRQFAAISSRVEPLGFSDTDDGRVAVDVHAVVHDVDGALLSDGRVRHTYAIDGGLVRRMEIEEA